MSELHVRQIKAAVARETDGQLDLTDLDRYAEPDREAAALSRGLAAYALSYVAGVPVGDACRSVTDGTGDNGIDLVYYEPSDRALYIVQSKWHARGSGSISLSDVQKYLKGVRDLVNARWDRFNEKMRQHVESVDTALNDTATRIQLLVAYTGQEPLGNEARDSFNDFLADMNNPSELMSLHVMRQADIYAAVSQGLDGAPINVDVVLYE